ncbi:class I SAM-dependent methyltransferase [Dactylosporangium sp. CA-092794]|uniref:class I SAM-dependent methyltransferase n=1 Tax=Dactylosporangium sp. CA-092794 TaxID=3239929 RepID=UPI003D89F13E
MSVLTGALRKGYNATWGKYVFAGMYDRFLARVEKHGLSEKRAEMLAPAYGRTIELGTGTGLNLPHYPDAVTELVLTEPYPPMVAKLQEKVRDYPRPVQLTVAGAEKLPFPDASFDTVAAAMILCTVPDPGPALAEISRVLKPGGQYLFLEHVRHADPKVARKQDLVQIGWYWFGNECHCNRPTVQTLQEQQYLEIAELKHDKIPGAWEFIEAMIIGRAVRTEHGLNGNGKAISDTSSQGGTHSAACDC